MVIMITNLRAIVLTAAVGSHGSGGSTFVTGTRVAHPRNKVYALQIVPDLLPCRCRAVSWSKMQTAWSPDLYLMEQGSLDTLFQNLKIFLGVQVVSYESVHKPDCPH